jgi:hypothetical protein
MQERERLRRLAGGELRGDTNLGQARISVCGWSRIHGFHHEFTKI